MQEVVAVATVSMLLYFFLAVVSASYYWKFKAIKAEKSSHPNQDFGRYDDPKILFFLVLTVSAILDIPIYVGCLVEGGPTDCEWDNVSYPVCWCLHLIAVCGYIFTIVTPPVLWSDIINKKDGKLWFSKYPMDRTKWFFQISLIAFWLLMLLTIILVIIFFKANDHKQFSDSGTLNAISDIGEPLLTFLIIAGCLFSGVRLQNYVMRVKLGSEQLKRFLFQLNVTLVIILATYLSRSLMVLHLASYMPQSYRRAFNCPYYVWALVTRWLPYIFCSFCLINEMKYSGSQIAEKYQRTTHGGSPQGDGTGSRGVSRSSSHHSLLIAGDQMTLNHMHAESDDLSGSEALKQALLSNDDSAAQYRFDLASPPDDSYLMQDDVANTYDDTFDLNAYLNEHLTRSAAAEAAYAAGVAAGANNSGNGSDNKGGRASTTSLSFSPNFSSPKSDTFMLSSSVQSNDMFNPDTDF